MAPITMYDGRTDAVPMAANTAVWLIPTIADATLKKVLVAELETGDAIQCGIESFGVTASPNQRESQKLCDADVVTTAGSTRFALEDLIIEAGDPQKPNALLANLVRGKTMYAVRRDGMPHATAPDASQLVHIAKIQIQQVISEPAQANADGNTFQVRVMATVLAYEEFATISAT